MPPSRFNQVSPYRNLLAISKKDSSFSEIPVSTTGSDSTNLISASTTYWIAKGQSLGQLICMPYQSPGKCANKTPGFVACSGGVSDVTTSPFDDNLIGVGSEKGEVRLFKSPTSLDPLEYNPRYESCGSFSQGSLSGGKPIDKLVFHTTTSALVAACSGQSLAIWDLPGGSSAKPVNHFTTQAAFWDIQWSWDGDLLGGTTKAGQLSIWDPRATDSPVGEAIVHGVGGQKCSRLAWVGPHILTTGVNKLREREISLFDPRALSKGPIKSQSIDSSTGVLIPYVDPNRSLVYLAGRGETLLRWFDLSSTLPGPIEVHHTRLTDPIAGIAMAPINERTVNVMQTELCRFLILGKNCEVMPVVMQAPKRQYLDFHRDVMPPVRSMSASQNATDWISGSLNPIDLVSQDPASFRSQSASTSAVHLPNQAGATSPHLPRSNSSPHPPTLPSSQSFKLTSPSQMVEPPELNTKPRFPPLQSVDLSRQHSTVKIGLSAAPNVPPISNTRWSRKYLSGKTPMKADYEDLRHLSTTFAADRPLITCTPRYFYIPLEGAGGKVGVIGVEKKGRLPTHVPAFLSGANVSAIEADLLVEGRVFVGGDDSKVRAFRVPTGGLESDTEVCELLLSDPKMGRILVVKTHPSAQDVLLTVSDDQGHPTVRVWDIKTAEPTLIFPLPEAPISAADWSIDGSLIAISTKTGKLHVLDPRNGGDEDHCYKGDTHESSRPVQLAWVDNNTHLLTAGFSNVSMREVKLHKIDRLQRSITTITRIAFDTSPSAFFIHYDPDVSAGFCWSKGERTLHLIELVFEDGKPSRLESLTPFVHSTTQTAYAFFPKQIMDVTRIEVDRALRLTSNSVEVVSFHVPRSRAEYFQDDIFLPTRQVLQPTYESVTEWLKSHRNEVKARLVDLRPEGMVKLSEAPTTRSKINQNALIASGPRLTESQKQEKYLENLFKSAKRDDDTKQSSDAKNKMSSVNSDDDDEIVGKSRVGAPVDDDW